MAKRGPKVTEGVWNKTRNGGHSDQGKGMRWLLLLWFPCLCCKWYVFQYERGLVVVWMSFGFVVAGVLIPKLKTHWWIWETQIGLNYKWLVSLSVIIFDGHSCNQLCQRSNGCWIMFSPQHQHLYHPGTAAVPQGYIIGGSSIFVTAWIVHDRLRHGKHFWAGAEPRWY
jgi:hypothetical protein